MPWLLHRPNSSWVLPTSVKGLFSCMDQNMDMCDCFFWGWTWQLTAPIMIPVPASSLNVVKVVVFQCEINLERQTLPELAKQELDHDSGHISGWKGEVPNHQNCENQALYEIVMKRKWWKSNDGLKWGLPVEIDKPSCVAVQNTLLELSAVSSLT